MMTVPMDNSSAPSTGELVQRLFNKNNELEKGLRMAAKSKVPSDPNAWLQMRENYEAIVLEDHNFSEKHEIEYALWQLHYRRIEEFRAHISASGPAASSNGGGKGGVSRPDRIKKIRSVFKGFLSEASGFYHDLILKIRAKYGLPLGYISGSPENEINLTNDMKKSAEMKKGSLSCHRCLIYLGDLARYKGLYGESGDSVARDYAAASSYYLQAASIWPSSGNPHHQLAILASYSGDDLMAVYRYFRSLAVDSPFSTARDNLIIAFEKNRHSYSQLFGDAKVSTIKTAPVQVTGRGRGRGHAKVFTKEINRAEADPIKEKVSSVPEMYKAFCIQFVRLNGILFTRTSLETFGEIFSLIMADFKELLSSGPEEKLNFGSDAAENGLFILRLIAILIFTVHNSNRESEGQSYAEILQRSVLLQNAFFAAFEFLGHILKRCIQMQDMLSSYLLPAILVFIEWLACRPDIVAVTDVEEKQANARSFFWTECVAFLNKLISSGHVSVYGDEEETCFIDMRRYDEGEAGNHFALWEDFELRGFLPLHPAHLILDFSRKLSFGSSKDKKARVDRILSAGRSLMNVVKVEKQGVFFDQKLKKFCVGVEPRRTEDDMLTASAIDVTQSSGMMKQGILPTEKRTSAVPQPPKAQFFMEGEEEDEVIVFKPPVAEKHTDVSLPKSVVLKVAVENSPTGDWAGYGGTTFSPPLNDSQLQAAALATSIQPPTSSANIVPQPLPEVIDRNISNWLTEQHYIDGFKNLSIVGNGFVDSKASELQENHKLPSYSHPFSLPISLNGGSMFSAGPVGVSEAMLPSRFDPVMPSGAITDGPAMLPSRFDSVMLSEVFTDGPGMLPYRVDPVIPSGAVTDGHTMMMKLPASSLTSSRKHPVSRPVGRHFGPPPGFSPIPPARQLNESAASMGLKIEQHPLADDYSWLDGYQYPPSVGIEADSYSNYKGHLHHQHVSSGANSSTSDVMGFPFPGKQVSNVQVSSENQRKWQDTQLLEHLKLYNEQQVQRRNQQSPAALPEPHQGQSLLSGRFFV